MGFWSRLIGAEETRPIAASMPVINAMAGQTFNGLDDPALLEFMRRSHAHGNSSARQALQTACVLRCVDLLSSSLAMLPARVVEIEAKREAVDHPVNDLIRWQPSERHTAFEFYRQMEVDRLTTGNAYALVVRSTRRIIGLEWLHPSTVEVVDNNDFTFSYRVTRPDSQVLTLPASDILHVRDITIDGVTGEGRTKLAAEAIRISQSAGRAQNKIFDNGMMSGGALTHPETLGPEAHERLRKAMEERHSGTDNAGRWMVLEEGMKAERFTMTGQEAQAVEARNHQIEDIARAFGVPRPLLMMDDTSWGSGIEQLAMLFVRFGLNPGIVAWEQAMRKTLLTPAERRTYTIDIDEHELLRGTMKDQAEFYAQALGSGGHAPWMEQNEVREATGFAPHEDGEGLKQMGMQNDSQNPAP